MDIKSGIRIPYFSSYLHMAETFANVKNPSTGEEIEIKYRSRRLIAEGRWAAVYQVEIVSTGEVIAMKQFKKTNQFKVQIFIRIYRSRLKAATRRRNIEEDPQTREYRSIALFYRKPGLR
jgi:hypothetical protein